MVHDNGIATDPLDRPYPEGQPYSKLLEWHLDVWGTRFDSDPATRSDPWDIGSFVRLIFAMPVVTDGVGKDLFGKNRDFEHSIRLVNHWQRLGSAPPKWPEVRTKILSAFFGEYAKHHKWKNDLVVAYGRAIEERVSLQRKGRRSIDRETFYPIASRNQEVAVLSMPFPTDYFIGRSREVEKISAALASGASRAVLLQGGPGIGKTELAKAIGNDAKTVAHFGDRRWFVSLQQATSAKEMREAIGGALGVRSSQNLKQALDKVAETPCLLVLDNLETPWEAPNERVGTESILAELSRTPSLSILASFRGKDRVKVPNWKRYAVEALDVSVAKELFVNIAGDNVFDDALFSTFIDALGGIPLAIHLLAQRASGRTSLQPLWREWQERGVDILTLPDEPAGPLSSFSQSILLSLDSNRTTDIARRLFGIIGYLPTGILDEHVSSIIGDGALDAVESLIQVGLIVENSGRIDLLPPIREYARRNVLISVDDKIRIENHYLDFVAKFGVEAGTAKDNRGIRYVESEMRNIESAFLNAFISRNVSRIGEAFRGLNRILPLSAKGSSIFEEIDDERFYFNNDMFSWAYVNIIVGHSNLRHGNISTADRAFSRGSMFLKNSRISGRPEVLEGRAESHKRLAEINIARGRFDAAREEIELAYSLCARHDDMQIADIYRVEARLDLLRGDYESCYSNIAYCFSQCSGHDFAVLGMGLHVLGEMRMRQNDFTDAKGALEEALGWFRRIDCILWQARCLSDIGQCFLQEENYEEARSNLEKSVYLYDKTDDITGIIEAKRRLEEVMRLKPTAVV